MHRLGTGLRKVMRHWRDGVHCAPVLAVYQISHLFMLSNVPAEVVGHSSLTILEKADKLPGSILVEEMGAVLGHLFVQLMSTWRRLCKPRAVRCQFGQGIGSIAHSCWGRHAEATIRTKRTSNPTRWHLTRIAGIVLAMVGAWCWKHVCTSGNCSKSCQSGVSVCEVHYRTVFVGLE